MPNRFGIHHPVGGKDDVHIGAGIQERLKVDFGVSGVLHPRSVGKFRPQVAVVEIARYPDDNLGVDIEHFHHRGSVRVGQRNPLRRCIEGVRHIVGINNLLLSLLHRQTVGLGKVVQLPARNNDERHLKKNNVTLSAHSLGLLISMKSAAVRATNTTVRAETADTMLLSSDEGAGVDGHNTDDEGSELFPSTVAVNRNRWSPGSRSSTSANDDDPL